MTRVCMQWHQSSCCTDLVQGGAAGGMDGGLGRYLFLNEVYTYCWEALLPQQPPLHHSISPVMPFPPILLSPAQQPLLHHCCGSAVSFPPMPSQNPPLHRSFPLGSFQPSLSPSSSHPLHRRGPMMPCHPSLLSPPALLQCSGSAVFTPSQEPSLAVPAASSLYSTSLRPFLLRAVLLFHKLVFFSILARACHSPHKLFSAASASTCSASSSTVLAA